MATVGTSPGAETGSIWFGFLNTRGSGEARRRRAHRHREDAARSPWRSGHWRHKPCRCPHRGRDGRRRRSGGAYRSLRWCPISTIGWSAAPTPWAQPCCHTRPRTRLPWDSSPLQIVTTGHAVIADKPQALFDSV